jgi:hypothetical protein
MRDLEISKIGSVLVWDEPVEDLAGNPITDATATLSLYRASDGARFDWDDLTFKTSGIVEPSEPATHLGLGLYNWQLPLEKPDGSINMTDGQILRVVIEVTLSSGAVYRKRELIQCTQTGYAAAIHSNLHAFDNAEDQDVVYARDGVTEIGRHDVVSVPVSSALAAVSRSGNVIA